MPENGYPTEAELKELKKLGSLENWKLDREYKIRFLDFIQDIWWAPDWGFKLKGKNVLWLELHTGGWSGNEEIISILERTFFWTLYFAREDRGGHFYFKITEVKHADKTGKQGPLPCQLAGDTPARIKAGKEPV